MTRDHVQTMLNRAIMAAVEAAFQAAIMSGKTGCGVSPGDVQAKAVAYAAQLVMPAVDLLADEAVQCAVVDACQPYANALLQETSILGPIGPATSPLRMPWLHGALTAFDSAARQFGIKLDFDTAAAEVNDGEDLMAALAQQLAGGRSARLVN